MSKPNKNVEVITSDDAPSKAKVAVNLAKKATEDKRAADLAELALAKREIELLQARSTLAELQTEKDDAAKLAKEMKKAAKKAKKAEKSNFIVRGWRAAWTGTKKGARKVADAAEYVEEHTPGPVKEIATISLLVAGVTAGAVGGARGANAACNAVGNIGKGKSSK